MIYDLAERRVSLPRHYYIADNATVIGAVVLHEHVSVWFNAVIRGDNDRIEIGPGSNVQENAVLHVDPGYPLHLGAGVTVGHKVMLHGCTIGDNCLIGINSVIMNGAFIGDNCLIGANSLITENKSFEAGSLIVGSPARAIRKLDAEQIEMLRAASQSYRDKIKLYRDGLRPAAPG